MNASATVVPAAPAAAAGSAADVSLGSVVGSERGVWNDVLFPSYPVTKAILWIMHLLYVFHWWKQRRRRQQLQQQRSSRRSIRRVTYDSIVERLQFYPWWEALLSHYQYPVIPLGDSVEQTASGAGIRRRNGGGLVDWISDHEVVRPILDRSRNLYTSWTTSVAQWLDNSRFRAAIPMGRLVASTVHVALGGRSFWALWYNTHLLWSCRALEQHYAITEHSTWSYVRVVVSLCLWAILLEIGLTYYLLRVLSRIADGARAVSFTDLSLSNSTPSQLASPEGMYFNDEERVFLTDSRTFREIRLTPVAASPSVFSSALIMMFRCQFPHVRIPFIPPLGHVFSGHGNAYAESAVWVMRPMVVHLAILVLVIHLSGPMPSSKNLAIKSIGLGSLIGWAWKSLGLDFCANTYWGNGILTMLLVLTVVSLKAHYPNSIGVAWLDFVAYNSRTGRALVYDDQSNQWLPENHDHTRLYGLEPHDNAPSTARSENLEADTSSVNAVYGETEMLPHHDDGGSSYNGDEDDTTTTELTPLSSSSTGHHHVRSRRGNITTPSIS